MGRPFSSVLIANRGEIAVRISRACREAGLRSIAVYSDADAGALHVRRADEAYRIGPPPVAESYLNDEAILEAAARSGAEAVHPGYGFLSENAAFAERCLAAGLVWIGPTPAAMRLLGDKAAAKALAERVGVPILPGYHGDAQDDDTLRGEAERVGFPLLVKAAAGGGGRGMRLVRSANDLEEALAAARRESLAAFGNDRLLLERYVELPRHVEMQLFGDEHGAVLYLGERDCSIQRRHQKIIEEAPAPNFTEEQRAAMGEAAVALARAAGYVNAGTTEFLVDQEDGCFYFLEVNTRLQVEHPVTEMVTGLDLVRLQFQVAAGEPIGIAQSNVRMNGHAIECRLYAEDPAAGFLPSAGRLTRFEIEEDRPTLRVDAGVEPRVEVPPYYDPLLAKIIAWGSSRRQAIRTLAAALEDADVGGVETNLDLLRIVVESSAFGEGAINTHFLEQGDFLHQLDELNDDVVVAAAASEARLDDRTPPTRTEQSGDTIWHRAGPWRIGWAGIELIYTDGRKELVVRFAPPIGLVGPWRFDINGRTVERWIRFGDGASIEVGATDDGAFRSFDVQRWPGRRYVQARPHRVALTLQARLSSTAGRGTGFSETQHDVIRSPMPGRVVKLLVAPGDRVKANQTLLVLEAMKIEHLVTAPRDAIVEAVRCTEGDQVGLSAELIELED